MNQLIETIRQAASEREQPADDRYRSRRSRLSSSRSPSFTGRNGFTSPVNGEAGTERRIRLFAAFGAARDESGFVATHWSRDRRGSCGRRRNCAIRCRFFMGTQAFRSPRGDWRGPRATHLIPAQRRASTGPRRAPKRNRVNGELRIAFNWIEELKRRKLSAQYRGCQQPRCCNVVLAGQADVLPFEHPSKSHARLPLAERGSMDFGSLQTVTAWRLCRTAATHARCQGIVVHGPGGFRLVVIENQQIVEWTRVETASALRKHVRSTFSRLCKAGWRPVTTIDASEASRPTAAVRPVRPRERRLLRIAEQAFS